MRGRVHQASIRPTISASAAMSASVQRRCTVVTARGEDTVQWHNADLAAHGLAEYLDELVYTSDLPHSKPHPSVFQTVAGLLGTAPAACVMIGDRLLDDVGGALGVGMRAVWKQNTKPWPRPPEVTPTATIRHLAELPPLLRTWGGR